MDAQHLMLRGTCFISKRHWLAGWLNSWLMAWLAFGIAFLSCPQGTLASAAVGTLLCIQLQWLLCESWSFHCSSQIFTLMEFTTSLGFMVIIFK